MVSLSISLLCPLATTNLLLSVSVDLPVLDISYKWIDLVHDPLYLAFFTWHNVVCYIYPLYGYIIFYLPIHPLMEIGVDSTLGPL